jgi:hypothetical protein
MKFKHILGGGVALACVALASQANAVVITFSQYGGANHVYGVPTGEELYANFLAGLPAGASGTGSLFTEPTFTNPVKPPGVSKAFPHWDHIGANYVAPPAYAAKDQITGQFFVIQPGQTETFTFAKPMQDVALYVGSFDPNNTITLNLVGGGKEVFTGAGLSGTVPGLLIPANYATGTNILAAGTNGRLTFIDPKIDIKSITLSQGLNPIGSSFEIAQVMTSVPEVSTWLMMLAGFAGLGFVGYRRQNTGRA